MDIVIQPIKRTIVLQADNPRQDITLISQSRPIIAEQKPPAVIEHTIARKEIVFAKPNMRGPKGEDGQDGQNGFNYDPSVDTIIAGSSQLAYRVMTVNELGRSIYADPNNPDHVNKIIGISLTSPNENGLQYIKNCGTLEIFLPRWVTGQTLYLGFDGEIQHTNYGVKIGTALSPSKISIDIEVLADGTSITQTEVRAIAADQDTVEIFDYDALVSATLGV